MPANSRGVLLAIAFFVLTIVVAALWYFSSSAHPGLQALTLGANTVFVSVADTEQKRELGLGGRSGLASNEGMLFIFPKEGTYGFWMKDMRFPVDILWLSNDGTVIYIQEKVSPDTYPHVFTPGKKARYVLELPAGYSTEHHILVGDRTSI